VSAVPRTIIDLAPSLDDRALRRLVNEAQIRTGMTPEALTRAIERAPGRATSRIARIVDGASGPRRSGLEDALWEALLRAGLAEGARCNLRIDEWEVDVAWPSARLVVEADGFRYHRTRDDRRRDERKHRALRRRGFEVLRFSDDEIADQLPRVVAEIALALGAARGRR
jgi:very-short-patch-repair endonuclease